MAETIVLSELIDSLENGGRPKGGVGGIRTGIPSVGGEHITRNGDFDFTETRFIPKEYYSNLRRGKIRQQDILVVKDGATTGKVAFVEENFPFTEAAVNEHVFIVRPKRGKVVPRYLFFYLFSPLGQKEILSSFHGAAQGGINSGFVDYVNVPTPSIEAQEKIVKALDQAYLLRRKREQANQLTTKITQSVFLKMFEDPNANPKGWEITTIGDHATIRYGTGSPPPYEENGIAFVRATDIKKGRIVKREMKFISQESAKRIEKCRLREGNLLFVRSGVNTGDCAYVTAEYDGAYAAYDLILDFDQELSSRFVWEILNMPYGRTIMKPMTLRAAQPHLNANQVASIKVPKPSFELQRKFVSFIKGIDSLEERQARSTQEINELFHSLVHKAFSGELALAKTSSKA